MNERTLDEAARMILRQEQQDVAIVMGELSS